MCSGYQRERIFITNHGVGGERQQACIPTLLRPPEVRRSFCRKKNDALPPIRNEQSRRGSPARYTGIQLSLAQDVVVRNQQNRGESPGGYTGIQLPLAQEVAVHHMFRQHLLSEFIHHYLPDSRLVLHHPLRKDNSSWFVLVAELPDLTTALEASVLALSTAKMGRLKDDPGLLRASLRLYGEGLSELQKALWDPNLMYRDETLAACMALWMYEVMECPSETVRGWISHFGGCERLIQLRGAEAHASALSHQVFLAFRTTAVCTLPSLLCLCRGARDRRLTLLSTLQIYQVIKSRRETYLAEPDWTELPWKEADKTCLDQLLDHTAVLANLFVQASEMDGLEPASLLPKALKVVNRCWKIESELRRIYKDFKSASPGPLHWPELSREANPADDADLGKLFPVAFHFPNLGIAFTCMMYWASLILLWAVLSQAYQVLCTLPVLPGDPRSSAEGCGTCTNADGVRDTCRCAEGANAVHLAQFDSDDLPPSQPRINVLEATRNICQSLEYCMRAEMRSLGTTVTVIPLIAVIDILPNFPHCSRELAWAKAAFARVNEKGFRLMRYIESEFLRPKS